MLDLILPVPQYVMSTTPQPSSVPTIHYTNRYYKRCCPAPFVIWFRERSGSSYICSLLDSHPEVLCRREDFDLAMVDDENDYDEGVFRFKGKVYRRQFKGFKNTSRNDPTPTQTVEHLRRIMSQPKTACGFKFKFDIQVASYPEIVDELHWLTRQLRVLLLTRENFLKQAVSRQNMERLQVNQNQSNLGKARRRLPPLQLDVERAVHYANCFKADNQKFLNSVANFANVKNIVYEKLLADPTREIKELLEFMGVDPEIELTANINKATPDRLSEAIENFDELAAAVAGTDLEAYLD